MLTARFLLGIRAYDQYAAKPLGRATTQEFSSFGDVNFRAPGGRQGSSVADEFGEDPIPPFAANVLSTCVPVKAGDEMRFNRSTAKGLINASGALLEDVATVSGEASKNKAHDELPFLITSL